MAAPLQVPRRSSVVTKAGIITFDWDNFLQSLTQQLAVLTPAGTFANNAAALAAGLAVGQVYQTATGEMRVVV